MLFSKSIFFVSLNIFCEIFKLGEQFEFIIIFEIPNRLHIQLKSSPKIITFLQISAILNCTLTTLAQSFKKTVWYVSKCHFFFQVHFIRFALFCHNRNTIFLKRKSVDLMSSFYYKTCLENQTDSQTNKIWILHRNFDFLNEMSEITKDRVR